MIFTIIIVIADGRLYTDKSHDFLLLKAFRQDRKSALVWPFQSLHVYLSGFRFYVKYTANFSS